MAESLILTESHLNMQFSVLLAFWLGFNQERVFSSVTNTFTQINPVCKGFHIREAKWKSLKRYNSVNVEGKNNNDILNYILRLQRIAEKERKALQ